MEQKERWNTRYGASDELLFGAEPNAFLRAQRPLMEPGMRALAIADGEARNGVWLAEQGLDVVSLDISEVAQEKAARLARSRNVSLDLRLVDALQWEWPSEEFDIVVAIFIQFAGPEEREILFDKMKKALRKGGILLLEGYRPEQIAYATGGPSAVENLYTADMLREAFADFEILRLDSYDAEISEGAAHSGMSALIDLVAKRIA
jgi:cyclopropane fatty-acyl-phospholipid synthase-like methyltransferase